MVSVVVLKLER